MVTDRRFVFGTAEGDDPVSSGIGKDRIAVIVQMIPEDILCACQCVDGLTAAGFNAEIHNSYSLFKKGEVFHPPYAIT